jgi:hypothetical protein
MIKIGDNGVVQWNKTYGRTTDYVDYWDSSVQQTNDGGFIITGSFSPLNDKSRIYLIKTDRNGTLQWEKIYRGTRNAQGNFAQQTADGGYVIVGIDGSFYREHDSGAELYLIKTDNMGNQQWSEKLSGKGWAEGCYVQQTKDGNYIVSGFTRSNPDSEAYLYLVKIANNAHFHF